MGSVDALSLAAFVLAPEKFKLAEDTGSAEPIAEAVGDALTRIATSDNAGSQLINFFEQANKMTSQQITDTVASLRAQMQKQLSATAEKPLDWSKFQGDPVGTGKQVLELKRQIDGLQASTSQTQLLQNEIAKLRAKGKMMEDALTRLSTNSDKQVALLAFTALSGS